MRGLSLQLKVSGGFILFLLLILCLHLLFFVPSFEKSQLEREIITQSAVCDQLADSISANLNSAMEELESVARFPEISSMKKDLMDYEIREVNGITQNYNYYFVLDPEGTFVSFPTQERLVGARIPKENMWWLNKVIDENKTVFVDVLVSLVDTVVSGFGTPIRNEKGEPIGAIRGAFVLSDANPLLKMVKAVNLGSRGFAYLVTSEGKLLAHPRVPLSVDNVNSTIMSSYPPVQKAMKGERGFIRYKWENEDWFASHSPIEVSGWGIIVQQPASEVFAVVKRFSNMLFAFFGFASLIGGAMMFFIFGYTLKPLSVLVASIRGGRLDSSVQYPKNEIGSLANEFNRLYHDLFHSKEELSDEREKYRLLVENQTDLVVKTDSEGNCLFASPSFLRLFGLSEGELSGRSCFQYISEDLVSDFREKFEKSRGELKSSYTISKAVTGDGPKNLEWVTTPIFGNDGKIEALVATGRDITLRLKTEEALFESEEKFRDLADQSPNMIFINKVGRVVYANKLSEEILGYTREEIYSPQFNFYSVIAPESIRLVEDKFRQHLKGEDVPPYEYTIMNKYGKKYDVINATKLIKYEGGNAILGIVTDITERKNTEKALKESEKQYRVVVENANDGIIISQKERIVFANKKFNEMLGYRAEELKNLTMGGLTHRDDREMVLGRQVRNIKGEEEGTPYSFRMITKPGDAIWVETNSVPIEWGGGPALLSFIRNITVQKNLENELIQAEKMKSIGALAGGIAHDFNNKLQLIGANCYLLLMKRSAGDEDYDELTQIKDITEKSGDLVKQLLSISKKLRSTLQPVNLNTIIKKLVEVLERSFPKSISIRLNPGADLWPVNADAGQLEQVIINLAFNSKDAMPSGGEVTISTGNAYLSKDFSEAHIGLDPGKHVRITFSDTGCGMDELTLAHIFEPTFSTKGDKKGFGLGLAMVYNILKNHRSAIFCKSSLNAGTTFDMYFPVAAEKAGIAPGPEKKADPETGKETLLVIDDEENILSLASKILPRYGYSVFISQSGEEGLNLYSKNWKSIDVLLVDLLMPGMDGKECLRNIYGINPNARVIMMSGEPVDALMGEELMERISGTLYKPFDFSELLAKIRLVVDGK